MLEFNENRKCSKCGFDKSTMNYHSNDKQCNLFDNMRSIEEHLHKRCLRCHYDWVESIIPMEEAAPMEENTEPSKNVRITWSSSQPPIDLYNTDGNVSMRITDSSNVVLSELILDRVDEKLKEEVREEVQNNLRRRGRGKPKC